MDIEKLKSIIRLANNNPNEHEANLAARKACKILAENDFALLSRPIRTAADKLNQHASNYGTWADVKRSTEPFWSSKPYEAQGTKEARAYQDDWFKKWNNYWKSAEKDPVDGVEYESRSWDEETIPKYKSNIKYDSQGKRVRESAKRTCSKCGVEVSTFRFKEEPFVCNPCHWSSK